jgi:hypothetical protein
MHIACQALSIEPDGLAQQAFASISLGCIAELLRHEDTIRKTIAFFKDTNKKFPGDSSPLPKEGLDLD